MNIGERDEIICKIYLTYKRDNNSTLFGEHIRSVGFKGREYGSLPSGFNLNTLQNMDDDSLDRLAMSLGMGKAPTGAKADVYINGVGVSLKSLAAAPAALVNHTARPGFEFACRNARASINMLDEIVDKYWELRMAGVITEDTRISDANCPFRSYKEYLKPILEYFLFKGTGSKLSDAPAEYLIEFSNPINDLTYRKLTKADAVDAVWPKLIFSLRAKKGMPRDYDLKTYRGANYASIAKWVRYHSGDYRGALHIRTSK